MKIRAISLELIKQIWKHKLINNFDEKEEFFHVYIDSPFCTKPKCKFCIYKPTIIEDNELAKLKDKYYDQILISNINDFGDVLSIRQPNRDWFYVVDEHELSHFYVREGGRTRELSGSEADLYKSANPRYANLH